MRRLALLAIQRARRDGLLPTVRYALRRLGLAKRPAGPPAQVMDEALLDLQPGELVEVKSQDEIKATLDSAGKTRGLFFMGEMWKFCGGRFRVLKRLDRYKIESTGQTIRFKNTVLLEGVHCDGSNNDGCSATCYHFWREAWLKRLDDI